MEALACQIIAEERAYLVLAKPAGLICHSDGRTEEPSVAMWLAERYPETRTVGEPWVSPQGERVPIAGLAHRLDRTTSGVLIVARSPEMWRHLRAEFAARRIAKEYRAIIHGHTDAASGRIVAEIARGGVPKRWYAKPREEGHRRAAITNWRVLAQGDAGGEPCAELALIPETGRTHQLRVHLASIGHPLVGDHLYASGRDPLFGFARPALHAAAIAFTLPGGERVRYAAPLPPDWPTLTDSQFS